MSEFLTAIKSRRSYYEIDKASSVSNKRICELVEQALLYTPTAFHMQSERVVLLLAEHHDHFWSMVKEILRSHVPAGQFSLTEGKIASFANGFGTLLFYEDTEVTGNFAEKYPFYKENFPIWAQQSNGMLQFCIWTMLEEAGLGASLQHYNPLIDEEVRKEWKISASWSLTAQMPFGNPKANPRAKNFQPVEERLKIF